MGRLSMGTRLRRCPHCARTWLASHSLESVEHANGVGQEELHSAHESIRVRHKCARRTTAKAESAHPHKTVSGGLPSHWRLAACTVGAVHAPQPRNTGKEKAG
jgi:Zn-finger nucleic acid-binding protein